MKKNNPFKNVGVIGAGAWGTALAMAAARAGSDVLIWAREPEVVETINTKHENTLFLEGFTLQDNVRATESLEEVAKSDVLCVVTPAQFLAPTLESLKKEGLTEDVPLLLCSKGVDQKTLKLMSEVAEDIVPNPILILSGPTFADEIAEGLPASVSLACVDRELAERVKPALVSELFKIFITEDIIGAQMSGAVKNVVAIACGIAEGLEHGRNAQAAIITGGLAEIRRLCVAKGGHAETLLGLCGVGDVVLTCSSTKSRNMSLGLALGKGQTLDVYLAGKQTVAEGIYSADAVMHLAKELKVDVPICHAVYRIVHEKHDVNVVVKELLAQF